MCLRRQSVGNWQNFRAEKARQGPRSGNFFSIAHDPSTTMDLFDDPDYRQIVAAIATFLFASFFVYLAIPSNIESPAECDVPTPEQCQPGWEGKVLDEPSIKVIGNLCSKSSSEANCAKLPGTSAIQCYCPATGQLLGLINPATSEGVDRAIAKAQEAQPEWARTSFIQRRRVLKTLQKCVGRIAETPNMPCLV